MSQTRVARSGFSIAMSPHFKRAWKRFVTAYNDVTQLAGGDPTNAPSASVREIRPAFPAQQSLQQIDRVAKSHASDASSTVACLGKMLDNTPRSKAGLSATGVQITELAIAYSESSTDTDEPFRRLTFALGATHPATPPQMVEKINQRVGRLKATFNVIAQYSRFACDAAIGTIVEMFGQKSDALKGADIITLARKGSAISSDPVLASGRVASGRAAQRFASLANSAVTIPSLRSL